MPPKFKSAKPIRVYIEYKKGKVDIEGSYQLLNSSGKPIANISPSTNVVAIKLSKKTIALYKVALASHTADITKCFTH